MVKYIFIDVDGVLNTKSSWKKLYSIKNECVENLAAVSVSLNAKIILVSTWKAGFEKEYEKCSLEIKKIREILRENGADIFDKCPTLKGRPRNKEIERYCYYNEVQGDYLILDDDLSLYEKNCEEIKHVYEVNCETGLTKSDVLNIELLLSKSKKGGKL